MFAVLGCFGLLYIVGVATLSAVHPALQSGSIANENLPLRPPPGYRPPIRGGEDFGKKAAIPNVVPKNDDNIVPPKLLQVSKQGKMEGKIEMENANVLTAYLEPLNFDEWEEKPLPIRSTATVDQLKVREFPRLNSCSRLPEQMPADDYPDEDSFLPWLHDAFPTHDGKYIQFVAENRRRCHTGTTSREKAILRQMRPQEALFQHVPVKRIEQEGGQTRYRLASHEEADQDGMSTRFICRFKPSMEETLSEFDFDYDYASFRKKMKHTFKEDDGGIKNVHTAQLLFKCPVPAHLVDTVRLGTSVVDDFATLFVDLIPIRTPPRYGSTNAFMPPRYADALAEPSDRFNASTEWGDGHILPKIEDSGRWENVPICRPSLQEYYGENHQQEVALDTADKPENKHHLVACIWASAGYNTRGERFSINDGQRRLLEWINVNKLVGFDHFYLYDNSYAFSNETTLKPVADLFPDDITYIKWPYKICNNNPNNVDSPGDRSSQYAAEASCRLRFGPHVNWIGQFDIDEYLLPMGKYDSLLPLLEKLDEEGNKIISFPSWRAWPRKDFIEEPIPIQDKQACTSNYPCFDLHVPMEHTMLQAYNCDRQANGKSQHMPAEKQIYRPDYVQHHYVHYSTVTTLTQMNRTEYENAGYKYTGRKPYPDPKSRFVNELEEGVMLHTKAMARQDTAGWNQTCRKNFRGPKHLTCRIGVPHPVNADGVPIFDEANDGPHYDENGWLYNCYVNKKVEEYWVPQLEEALKGNKLLTPS